MKKKIDREGAQPKELSSAAGWRRLALSLQDQELLPNNNNNQRIWS